jgi:hypothetical protein
MAGGGTLTGPSIVAMVNTYQYYVDINPEKRKKGRNLFGSGLGNSPI